MKVSEIFISIQGESRFAGYICTFIRLAGCNLRCTYCDTQYAYHDSDDMPLELIVHKVIQSGVKTVEITGGEPLIQAETILLIEKLLDKECRVLIETNGSRSISRIDRRAIVILDIKTPGSGMDKEMDFSNIHFLKPADEVKFVITDRYDYEWSKEIIQNNNLFEKSHVLFSPSFGMLPPRMLAEWMIHDKIDGRLNLQLHKYIFGLERGK